MRKRPGAGSLAGQGQRPDNAKRAIPGPDNKAHRRGFTDTGSSSHDEARRPPVSGPPARQAEGLQSMPGASRRNPSRPLRPDRPETAIMGTDVKSYSLILAQLAFTALVACTPAPASEAPPPPAPPTPELAGAMAPGGPAAANTSDTLASAAPAGAQAPGAAAPAGTPAPAAVSTPGGEAHQTLAQPTQAQLDNGKAVFARTCAMCHGPSGEGTQMAVALTAGHDAATVKEKITRGMVKPGDRMPPLGAAMSAGDIEDVARFVEAGLPT